MKPRFSHRMPGDPTIADELLQGCYSLELKLHRFPEGETTLSYELKGELLPLAEADCDCAMAPPTANRQRAKQQVRELLAMLLDDDNGRAPV